jgi:hypothetical protein
MKKWKKRALWGLGIGSTLLFMAILGFLIYRLVSGKSTNWSAIGSIGQCACAVVGLLIPFAAIIVQSKIKKSEERISDSNLTTLENLNDFRIKFEPLLTTLKSGNAIINGGSANIGSASTVQNELQKKIYDFVCVKMFATTKEVAEYMNLSMADAKDALKKLFRVEEKIVPSSLSQDPDNDNCEWTKKR